LGHLFNGNVTSEWYKFTHHICALFTYYLQQHCRHVTDAFHKIRCSVATFRCSEKIHNQLCQTAV